MTASVAVRWYALFLSLLLLIVLPFLLFEQHLSAMAASVFEDPPGPAKLSALIASALALDVLLPIPSSLVNTIAGAMLGVTIATIVCWAGMTAGCLFGYWIGATGGTVAVRRLLGEAELARATRIAGGVGLGSLILSRAVPVLAEASTIAAGAARFPFANFVAVVALGNLGIAATYAAIGAYAYDTNSFLLAVAGAISVPAIGLGLHRLYRLLGSRSYFDIGGTRATLPRVSEPATGCVPPRDSPVVWQRFPIAYEYPVAFTRGLFRPDNHLFAWALGQRGEKKKHRCLVFIDGGVANAMPDLTPAISQYFKAHRGQIELVAPPMVLPGGEAIKIDFSQIEIIHDTLQTHMIDRHSYVVAIGGGAVLDAVGLAAATAHRGVRHVRIPTTVLAQNDSGVGVKNGVNLKGVKNYVGTFAPPWAVLNDFEFLACLPRRERISGTAEAVKVALIRDRDFFEWLEANVSELTNFTPAAEEYMIRRCAALHMHQIANGGDPFETGSARPLDFGHWSAHKLEAMSQHEVRHGEAVAIGIALDVRYSVLAGLLDEDKGERIFALLEELGFRLWHPALAETDARGRFEILNGLQEFQEHLGGELTITMLQDLGTGIDVNEMKPELVVRAIDWLSDDETG